MKKLFLPSTSNDETEIFSKSPAKTSKSTKPIEDPNDQEENVKINNTKRKNPGSGIFSGASSNVPKIAKGREDEEKHVDDVEIKRRSSGSGIFKSNLVGYSDSEDEFSDEENVKALKKKFSYDYSSSDDNL